MWVQMGAAIITGAMRSCCLQYLWLQHGKSPSGTFPVSIAVLLLLSPLFKLKWHHDPTALCTVTAYGCNIVKLGTRQKWWQNQARAVACNEHRKWITKEKRNSIPAIVYSCHDPSPARLRRHTHPDGPTRKMHLPAKIRPEWENTFPDISVTYKCERTHTHTHTHKLVLCPSVSMHVCLTSRSSGSLRWSGKAWNLRGPQNDAVLLQHEGAFDGLLYIFWSVTASVGF